MFYQLPPVGNPISLQVHTDVSLSSLFSSYQVHFYASGTASLAAAIIAAKKQKDIRQPEVILPAYGCPDLVSAVDYAGAKPVLVDLEVDSPCLDLSQLSSAINDKTVAIVAVNLFGIAERLAQLREVAETHDVVLIEDSAQYFPADGESKQDWQGDLIVLSFGRGKPVSLLGGGAVLTKNKCLFGNLPKPKVAASGLVQRLTFNIKVKLYNAMISPLLYWLPQALPFLHLGETRYHTLHNIEGMEQARLNILASNVIRYQNDAEAIDRCKKISSMVDSLARVKNLPSANITEEKSRLLRYPLLVEVASRERVRKKLEQEGLGVSTMYPASLSKIVGLSHILNGKKRFPRAESFASRLITLPTHSMVSNKSIVKLKAALIDTI